MSKSPLLPGQKANGTFAKGNQVAKKTGLYARCGLNKTERRHVGVKRRYLRDAGIPDDMAASMAIDWMNASRITEDFAQLETAEERAAMFDVYERAVRLKHAIFARRDRALAQGDPKADSASKYLQQAEELDRKGCAS